jgi:hypothetical protein
MTEKQARKYLLSLVDEYCDEAGENDDFADEKMTDESLVQDFILYLQVAELDESPEKISQRLVGELNDAYGYTICAKLFDSPGDGKLYCTKKQGHNGSCDYIN